MPKPEPRAATLPPFAAVRAFDALARLGGVRKAAEHLGVHHSVVSRQVNQLEALLGVALLHRSGNQFTLTADGERYHARISAAISEIADATKDLTQGAADKPLRVWCSPGLSISWLAGQIRDFEKLHPALRVELKPSDAPANLHVHEADVNIYMHLDDEAADAARAGLKSHLLTRPLLMIAASPDFAKQLKLSSPRALLGVPLLHSSRTTEWRSWLLQQGVDAPVDLSGELCWDPHMALEAARLGRGILLGHRFFFERDFARGDLIELNVPGATPQAIGGYAFVTREDRWSNPATAALRNFLTDRMRKIEFVR